MSGCFAVPFHTHAQEEDRNGPTRVNRKPKKQVEGKGWKKGDGR